MVLLSLSFRYAFSKSNRHRNASFVIMIGIAIGMMAIITMVGLMNSLQSELLATVRSVESFHLQLSNIDDTKESVVEKLSSIDKISGVYRVVNTQVLIQNLDTNEFTTSRLRLVDSSIWESNNPFMQNTHLFTDQLPTEEQALFGRSLAYKSGITENSSFRITLLGEGRTAVLTAQTYTLSNGGLFETTLPEFNSSTLISNSERLFKAIGNKRISYALFIDEKYINKESSIVNSIKEIYPDATVISWQEANRAFYSALTLEKVLLYLFLFFMFIILGINMKNATNRLIHTKLRELAILRCIGFKKNHSKHLFLIQAALVSLCAIVVGVVLALLLSRNISSIFRAINALFYLFTQRESQFLSYPFSAQIRGVEILFISIIVFFLSLLFSYIGGKRALTVDPMEMFYHE